MNLNEILQIIRPGAWYTVHSDSYNGLEWLDTTQEKPTEEEMLECLRQIEKSAYAKKRKAEYPPFEEYLDARVHELMGDPQPMLHYLNACAAVKRKYPKP